MFWSWLCHTKLAESQLLPHEVALTQTSNDLLAVIAAAL